MSGHFRESYANRKFVLMGNCGCSFFRTIELSDDCPYRNRYK